MRLVDTCDRFWEEKVPYTPESRVRVHEHLKAKREKEEKKEFVALWHFTAFALMLYVSVIIIIWLVFYIWCDYCENIILITIDLL